MPHPFAAFSAARALLQQGRGMASKIARMKTIIRDLEGLGPMLERSGSLELRLAATKKEIRKAQRLRYKVFFEEGNAAPERAAQLLRRDICPFDKVCDHLLVIDHAARGKRLGRVKPRVVGVYRLLRQSVAKRNFGFYSAREFDLAPLLARHPDKTFLELGRACVLAEYRGKGVIELLWQGIGRYLRHHGIDVMIGCASLDAADPARIAAQLATLRDAGNGARAVAPWAACALPHRHVPMGAADLSPQHRARVLRGLPPLVKAYLRCGAFVGEGAVEDRRFGTVDVLVILPVAGIAPRYLAQFARAPGGSGRRRDSALRPAEITASV